MAEQFKIHVLLKCCDQYPSPCTRISDGAKRVKCEVCGNATPYYLGAGLSANKGWNEKRRKQIKVENLYNGKPAWYKATTVEE